MIGTPSQVEAGVGDAVTALFISPVEEAQGTLAKIFDSMQWKLLIASTLSAGLELIRSDGSMPLVICDSDLKPGTWKELLEEVVDMSQVPVLIVSSHIADRHLWAEALHLGVRDVLARPFDENEVIRTVSLAWHHWNGLKTWQRKTRAPYAQCEEAARLELSEAGEPV